MGHLLYYIMNLQQLAEQGNFSALQARAAKNTRAFPLWSPDHLTRLGGKPMMQAAPHYNRRQAHVSLVSYTSGELALLKPGQVLVIHSQEWIVTLVDQGRVMAQTRCSARAFRALLQLLFTPGGADYGSLYAALEVEEEDLALALNTRSLRSSEAFEKDTHRWREYLANQPSPAARKAETLPLRRVMRGETGLDRFLTEGGFPWKLKATTWRAESRRLHRGYALTDGREEPRASTFRLLPVAVPNPQDANHN